MRAATAARRKELAALVNEAKALLRPTRADPHAYAGRPIEYAHDVLGVTLTPKQQEIARALLEPPHRVLVRSANNTGKTFLSGVLVNWFFDSYNPGLCITTAPDARGVRDTCWKEVRVQRLRTGLPGLRGDVLAEMRDAPNHYAKGYTIRPGQDASFVGRHDAMLFFLFEEACGLDPVLWETTRTMHKPDLGHLWFAIYNPTDTTARVHVEEDLADIEGNPFWRVFTLNALDHPNLVAQLEDRPPPIPSAVTRRQVEDSIASWCEEVSEDDLLPTDFSWPPAAYCACHGIKPRWFRPGPEFQARVLGQWPDTGSGVWSPTLWDACVSAGRPPFPLDQLPEIGCDCSMGKGDDFTSIHARWGAVSLHHESSNTMSPVRIFERLKAVCGMMAARVNQHRDRNGKQAAPQEIPVKIDDDGTGNAVADMLRREGYWCIPVGAATAALQPDRYYRRRDELWFQVAEKARRGEVYLNLLDRKTLRRLQQQLLAPEWELRTVRHVEPKADTKKKLGRSPDDADAFNLSHLEGFQFAAPAVIDNPRRRDPFERTGSSDCTDRRLFGRLQGRGLAGER